MEATLGSTGASLTEDEELSAMDAAVLEAIREDNAELARGLLSREGADVNVKSSLGRTYLMLASEHNQMKSLSVLLSLKADVHIGDECQATALHWASREGHAGVIQALVSAGAKLEVKNSLLMTPLHAACVFSGRRRAVETLLASGADLDARGGDGLTPLMYAAIEGHLAAIDALLTAGADLHVRQARGGTALYLACANGGTAGVVARLLSAGAAVDVNIPVDNGFTCLMWASERDSVDIARLLLAAGADAKAKDQFGNNALAVAMRKGHTEVAQLLVQHLRRGNGRGGEETASSGASAASVQEVASGLTALTVSGRGTDTPQPPEAAIVKKKSVKECMNCGKKGEDIKQCAGCQRVYLCSAACAKAAWPTHKTMCKKAKKDREKKEQRDKEVVATREKGRETPLPEDGGGKCRKADENDREGESGV